MLSIVHGHRGYPSVRGVLCEVWVSIVPGKTKGRELAWELRKTYARIEIGHTPLV